MDHNENIKLYLRALEHHRDGVSISDARKPDLPLIYVNEGFKKLTGYDSSEVVGKNCRFLQGEHDNTEARATIRRALAEGTDCRVILRNNRKDGTAFWNELTLYPLRSTADEVIYVVGVQHDVTERTEAVMSATRMAKRLAQLNEMGRAINVARDKSHLFQTAAKYVRKMFNATRTSIALLNDSGQSFDIYALVEDELGSPLTGTGVPIHDTAIHTATTENRIVYTPDLSVSPYREHKKLAKVGLRACLQGPLEAGGRIIGSLNMGSDQPDGFTDEDAALLTQITSLMASDIERRRLRTSADAALAESEQAQAFALRLSKLNHLGQSLSSANTEEEIFEILAKQLPEVVPFQQGRLSVISESNEHIQAISLEDRQVKLIGRRLLTRDSNAEEITPPQWDSFGEPGHMLDQRQGSLRREELRCRDQYYGRLEVLNVTLEPYAESDIQLLNQAAAFIATTLENVRMLHRLRAARRVAEESSASKSAFLANMSHEIRTPLNAIIGMTTLLGDTELNDEQSHFVDTVKQSSDGLLQIINDILDVSKIEADQLVLEKEPFELRACLEDALDLMAVKAAEKQIELAYFIAPTVPEWFFGDVTRLRQVIVNLLTNAVKFTSVGEVVLNAKGRHLHDPSGDGNAPTSYELEISIKDTGIGISNESLEDLFEPFSQVDPSTTRKFGGTGLGLAICKQLCELMGGRIWAESTVGVGSTFHFTCQLQIADGATIEDHPQARILDGLHILIVDDNSTNLEIIGQFTSDWGMLPQSTSSPVEALSWIQAGRRYDLVALDMRMPEMDGLALASVLRLIEASRHLPIVLLGSITAHDPQTKNKVKELGISALLTKPIKRAHLQQTLLQAVHGETELTQPQAKSQSPFDESIGRNYPLRILVAEDNKVNQDVIRTMLQRLSYESHIVSTGTEVIAALEREPYDIIFMDMHMPEMDGLTATTQIRARPEWQATPYIIAVTANAMLEHRTQCLKAGMNDFISKPIRAPGLLQALGRHRAYRDSLPEGTESAVPATQPEAPATETALMELLEDMGGDIEVLQDLLSTFEQITPKQIDKLESAVRSGDLPAISRAAHSICSGSAGIGARVLAEACRSIEHAAIQNESKIELSVVNEVRSLFAATCQGMQRFIDERSR